MRYEFTKEDVDVLHQNKDLTFKELYNLYEGKHDIERIECEYYKHYAEEEFVSNNQVIEDVELNNSFDKNSIEDFILYFIYLNRNQLLSHLKSSQNIKTYDKNINNLFEDVFKNKSKITSSCYARYFLLFYYARILGYTHRQLADKFGNSLERSFTRYNSIMSKDIKTKFLREVHNFN